ncbi:MAG: cytochrome c3 family protein [Synechococcus sp.]
MHYLSRLRTRCLSGNLPLHSSLATVLVVGLCCWLSLSSPSSALTFEEATELWTGSTHSLQNVNCSSCHQVEDSGAFVTAPNRESCQQCHEFSTQTFLLGKHGIRMLEGQSALTPEMALLPMKPASHGLEMNCNVCHDVHAQNVRTAAVDACLTCHSDRHSLNYVNSKHAGLLVGNEDLPRPGGAEVTCATCHLPRQAVNGAVMVNHNNTYTLKPRDRMVADVCMNCHGMEFAYNAIFDDELVTGNFDRFPDMKHQSLQMSRAERDRRQSRHPPQISNPNKLVASPPN